MSFSSTKPVTEWYRHTWQPQRASPAHLPWEISSLSKPLAKDGKHLQDAFSAGPWTVLVFQSRLHGSEVCLPATPTAFIPGDHHIGSK